MLGDTLRRGGPEERAASKTRLEAFSDGVFAIAATLLVLDLHARARPGQLASAPGHAWPHYATFVVSFLTTGIIWVDHPASSTGSQPSIVRCSS